MKGQHSCELLDEDRFVAPTDFVEEQAYEYYDMSREYEEEVRYYDTIKMILFEMLNRNVTVFMKCNGFHELCNTR